MTEKNMKDHCVVIRHADTGEMLILSLSSYAQNLEEAKASVIDQYYEDGGPESNIVAEAWETYPDCVKTVMACLEMYETRELGISAHAEKSTDRSE